ncbi:MAG: TolC family protein [Gemmatimonadetes bacterium]|nr:TolC family protein [Gemmatimonadota bacterium]NIR79324.1 TolC family protein [Gemmatimonadota bacterium]NIT87980.1 TolC family protein [Gemmatimonadota bacterium]NIU31831.1 TolC family protein [Gemmatimonadota bacterium]NIU36448.1 TolC family protein [Gemmatimonadota bacterium]
MRPQRAPALALAGLLFFGGDLSAQETPRSVDLEEALRLLHENSPEMALARSRVREAEGRALQAKAYPNPSISATHEALEGAGPDPSETYLNLSQRVEWPGTRSARSRAADRGLEAARGRFAADSLRLVFEVRRTYLESAAGAERLDVLEEVSAVFREAAGRADERFAGGDVSRYARDRIRLERVRYERGLAAARVELDAARRALGALILPGEGGAAATEGLPDGLPPRLEAEGPGPEAVDRHPTVVAARSGVEALGAEADLARSLRLPDPTLTGGYKTQSNGFDGLFVGISLPLPILDRRGGAITAAEARLGAERSRLDLARRSVERELRRAGARYRALRAQAELVGEGFVESGSALLETARVAYREGEMELVELLDAASARRDAGILSTQLLADVWTSYYELIRASGGSDAGSGSERHER